MAVTNVFNTFSIYYILKLKRVRLWYDYTCVAIFKSSMIKMQPNIQKSILHNKLIVCINSGRVLAPVVFTVEGCMLLLDIFSLGYLYNTTTCIPFFLNELFNKADSYGDSRRLHQITNFISSTISIIVNLDSVDLVAVVAPLQQDMVSYAYCLQ